MAAIEDLASEVGASLGIGPAAGGLLKEVVRLIFGQAGGLTSFLDTLSSNGLGDLARSWIGNSNNPPHSPPGASQAFGLQTIAALAEKVGIDPGVATAALAYLTPKLVGLLTAGGVIPTSVPAGLAAFLGAPAAAAAAPAPTIAPAAARAHDRAPPAAAVRTGRGHDTGGANRIIFPALAALLAAGIAYHFFTADYGKPAPAPEAAAPAATPAPAAPATTAAAPAPTAAPAVQGEHAHIAVLHDAAGAVATGVVPSEASRASILDALKATFGGRVVDGLNVDPHVGEAPWLGKISDAIALLKAPNLQAVFDGAKVAVGGALPAADVDAIVAKLKALFGGSVTVATLKPEETATFDVVTLEQNLSGDTIVAALNKVVLNFATGSAVVEDQGEVILLRAAELIKKLPAGTVVHIGGYTDQTGDPARNLVLSQQRADAVRKVLTDAGVAPEAVTAKGYGSAASSATGANRTDRRIEFSVQ
ncbi:OmpA family protein [Methylocella sp.]|uniref:OmpA family protein n=1 Tax=Methylocella sp. TaxID=1978226 RepID=UPI003783FD81